MFQPNWFNSLVYEDSERKFVQHSSWGKFGQTISRELYVSTNYSEIFTRKCQDHCNLMDFKTFPQFIETKRNFNLLYSSDEFLYLIWIIFWYMKENIRRKVRKLWKNIGIELNVLKRLLSSETRAIWFRYWSCPPGNISQQAA